MAELIGSFDVKERVRAKDTRGKGVQSSSANMVQKKSLNNLVIRRRRRSKRTTRSLNKQPLLRRKRTTKMVVALFTGVMSIGQVYAQTAILSNRRNLQTCLLARL